MRERRRTVQPYFSLAVAALLLLVAPLVGSTPADAAGSSTAAATRLSQPTDLVGTAPADIALPVGDPDAAGSVVSTPAAPAVDPNDATLRAGDRERRARSRMTAPGEVRVVPQSLTPPDPNPYRAAYSVESYVSPAPNYRYTGHQRVYVTNLSTVRWDVTPDGYEYYLTYSLFESGAPYVPTSGGVPITSLPHSVNPGETVAVDGVIGALPPGNYVIEWEMGASFHRFSDYGNQATGRGSFTVMHQDAVAEASLPAADNESFTAPPPKLYAYVYADRTLPVSVRFSLCSQDPTQCWASAWVPAPFAGDAGYVTSVGWAPPSDVMTPAHNYTWTIQVQEGSYVSAESPPIRFTVLGESTPAAVSGPSTWGPGTTGPGAGGVGTGSAASPRGQAQSQRGDPVNTATGAFSTTVTDLRADGPGVPLWVTRTYNSNDSSDGPFGQGWSWSYGMRIWLEANDDVTVRGGDGQQVTYPRRSDGSYATPPGFRSTLRRTAEGWELRTRPSGERYAFNASGLLTGYTNRTRLGVALSYTNGQLAQVTYPGGRRVSFTWGSGTTAGRIVRAAFVDGRQVLYGYTGPRLTSATDARGQVTRYAYDTRYTGRLISLTDPNSHRQYLNSYDHSTLRIDRQTDARGNVTLFGWDPVSGQATTTYPRGGVVTDTYVANVLTETRDANGFTTRFGYDAQLNRRYVTDRRGHTTFLTYDSAGNVTSQTDPLGKVQSWTYNNDDQVLTHTGARRNDAGQRDFTTTNTYDPVTGNLASTRTPAGALTTRSYFSNGLLQSLTAPAGNAVGASAATKMASTTTYTYYSMSQDLQKSVSGSGRTTSLGYDVMGRRTRVTSPRGNVDGCGCEDKYSILTTYDATDHIVTVADSLDRASGRAGVRTYDVAGMLATVTDPTGAVQTFDYDEANHPLSVHDGDGRELSSTTYDDDGNVASTRSGSESRTLFTRDLGGRIKESRDSVSACSICTTYYQLDENGNVTERDAPNGIASGSDGHSTEYHDFDAADRVIWARDPSGAVSTYGYDGDGNLSMATDPMGATTSYVRDRDNRVVETVDPLGHITRDTYDADGNLVRKTNAAQQAQSWSFDSDDELTASTDPRGNVAGCGCAATYTTRYDYDPDGHRSRVTDPLGHTTDYSFDPVGNQVAVRDGKGRTTAYGYDLAGRPTSVLASDTAVTTKPLRYSYSEKSGLLKQQTTPLGGLTSYTWDDYGRLATRTTGVGTWSYSYDSLGNLRTQTTPAGAADIAQGIPGAIGYTYDDAKLLRYIRFPGNVTSSVHIDYDRNGRRRVVRNGESRLYFDYDGAGRVVEADRSRLTPGDDIASTQTRTYDYLLDGSLRRVSRENVTLESWTYGADGRASSRWAPGVGSTVYGWTPAGQLDKTTDERGTVEQLTWGAAGDVDGVRTSRGSRVLSAQVVDRRDATGNPTQVSTSRAGVTSTRSYLYDSADRLAADCPGVLSGCTSSAASQAWSYDLNGNRVSEKNGVGVGVVTRYSYDAGTDQLTGVAVGSAPARVVSYDRDGNQLSDGVTARTYGVDGAVLTATVGGVSTSFTRDGLGNLLDTRTGGVTSGYDWDVTHGVPQLAAVTRAGVSTWVRYDPLGRAGSVNTSAGDSFFVGHDVLGSVTDLVDSSGGLARSYGYSAFGVPVSPVGGSGGAAGVGSPVRYAGMLSVDDGASYTTPRRDYSPGLGRWASWDPVPPVAGRVWDSPYAYVGNRPWVATDPLGEVPQGLRNVVRGLGDAAWDVGPGLVGDVAGVAGSGLDRVGVPNPGAEVRDGLDSVQGTLGDWSGGSTGTAGYNIPYGVGTAASFLIPGAGEARGVSAGVKGAEAVEGARAATEAARELPVLSFDQAQLEAKFKHANDFGVTDSRGAVGFEAYGEAVNAFVADSSTVRVVGTYRGDSVVLNYNPTSRLVVLQSPDGAFISGWQMSPAQLQNVITRGSLGGG